MILDARHGAAAMAVETGDSGAVEELCRLGFADLKDSADRRLLALLSAFGLRLQVGRALDGCAWIAAVPWEPPDGGEGDVFSGAGFRPADAIRSCLGEFAEFQSWLFRPGDVARRAIPVAGSIDAWSVLGFSDRQRAERRDYDEIPSDDTFTGEIDWCEATSLNDGSRSLVPAQLCFGRYAQRASVQGNWRNDSNGCAAGATAETARLAALLELIERDATGIWWYGQCRRPGVETGSLDHPDLGAALAARQGSGRQVHFLDLTHDLPVAVVAAIMLQDGRLLALGVGCKASIGAAAVSAYLELCQMELSVSLVQQRAHSTDDQLLSWMQDIDVARFPHLAPARDSTSIAPDPAPTFDGIVARLLGAGLRTYVVDLERAEIGIPACRLFVPGLCHFKPRLGHRRLVEVPKALGWRGADFSASDLNPTPLLI